MYFKTELEQFYHSFVLGLITELGGRYQIHSNMKSGFGRYDAMMEPVEKTAFAYIFKFKVHAPEDETSLSDMTDTALKQICESIKKNFLQEDFQKKKSENMNLLLKERRFL